MQWFRKTILGIVLLIVTMGPPAGASPLPAPPGDGSEDFLKELPPEARKVLMSGEKFVLFSLNPSSATGRARGETFHDYQVLGKVPIADVRQKLGLVNSLVNGMAHTRHVAKCFSPRHGIRASQGTNSVDLLICFECGPVYGFSSTGSNWVVATTIDPEKLFDDVLKRSGVPLAESPSRK